MLAVVVLSKVDEEEETHPDPNHENHPGMIYIGRLEGENDEDRRRVGFDFDNGEWPPLSYFTDLLRERLCVGGGGAN